MQANALNCAFAIAQKTDSGTVWVNKHLDLLLDVAFSGAKQSSFGAETGEEGLEESRLSFAWMRSQRDLLLVAA